VVLSVFPGQGKDFYVSCVSLIYVNELWDNCFQVCGMTCVKRENIYQVVKEAGMVFSPHISRYGTCKI